MSRFFAGDTESDSSEDEVQEPVRRRVVSLSSDEEDVKRVVQPAKEKYFGELKNIIQQINNHKKIKDYTSLLAAFDELSKVYEKARNPVFSIERVPAFFVACLAQLTAFVNAAWDDTQGRKTLSKNGYKSLAALRQKLRKLVKTFEHEIVDYNNNPDDYEIEAKVEDQPEIPEDEKADESSDFPDSDSETSSDDDDTPYENMRERFLKKSCQTTEGEPKKKERKEKTKKESKNVVDEDGEWEMVTGNSGVLVDQKLFAKDADITVSSVSTKLREILNLRRLKRAERLNRIERLRELFKITEQHDMGAGLKAKVKIAIISALFEYNISALEPMKTEHWEHLLQYVDELIDLLVSCEIKIDDHFSEHSEELENEPYKIKCNLSGMLVRVIEEFHKLLKSLDAFKNDFRDRFRDVEKIGLIIDKMLNFCEKNCSPSEISLVMLCKIEHIYFKVDPKVFDEAYKEPTSLDVIHDLSKYIFIHDETKRLRTRAILMKIYHLSLHNKWTTARDLFLMSNLQNGIEYADPATQILYNRALVQMGLAAFRLGNFVDAHQCLSDLVTSGRVRELLGQGFTIGRGMERTHEQELRERQFQTPFHMTINLDVIDATYLITSMLIDVPILAAREQGVRRKLISKHFYFQLRLIERLNLVGPPESLREHIIAASFALRNAKWQECLAYIINPKMKKKVWGLITQPSEIESILEHEVKKQSLKVYLYTYHTVYDSLSIHFLSEIFAIPVPEVESIIAGMILEEDLKASFHIPTESIVFHKSSLKNPVQKSAFQLLEKLTVLVEINERCSVPDKNLRPTASGSRSARFPIF